MMKKRILSGLLCAFASTMAFADSSSQYEFDGLYLGAGAGFSQYQAFTSDDYYALVFPTFSNGQTDHSQRYHIGYMINRIVGIELAYGKYGEHTFLPDVDTPSFKPSTYAVQANVGYTWNTGIRLFGLAGLGVVEFNQQGSEEAFFDENIAPSMNLGIGVGYTPLIDHGVTVRLVYDWATYFAKPNADVYVPEYDSTFYKLKQVALELNYQF